MDIISVSLAVCEDAYNWYVKYRDGKKKMTANRTNQIKSTLKVGRYKCDCWKDLSEDRKIIQRWLKSHS